MWSKKANQTITMRMAKLMTAPERGNSQDVAIQLNKAMDDVSRIMGKKVNVMLPIRRTEAEDPEHALLDITLLLTILRLVSPWLVRNEQFWEMIKTTTMDKTFFPGNFSDDPLEVKTSQ